MELHLLFFQRLPGQNDDWSIIINPVFMIIFRITRISEGQLQPYLGYLCFYERYEQLGI